MSLPSVQHLFSLAVHGAEGKHSVCEDRRKERKQLEKEAVQRRHQQVPVFGPGRCDGVLHGVDDHAGVPEALLTSGQEVLAGQVHVLPVEGLPSLLVQFLPDV